MNREKWGQFSTIDILALKSMIEIFILRVGARGSGELDDQDFERQQSAFDLPIRFCWQIGAA
jgi:hypothetical protein